MMVAADLHAGQAREEAAMRKLATVTAALALVAATFTFPSADARAGEVGVVILKCVETILAKEGEINENDVDGIAPTVVAIQATFTTNGQDKCKIGMPCAPCLEELINDKKCSVGMGFPGSPVVVGSVTGTSGLDFNQTVTIRHASIEKYVFQCEAVE